VTRSENTIDTDSILDKCHCGARAHWLRKSAAEWIVTCSECPETTGKWERTKSAAMVAWNKVRRK